MESVIEKLFYNNWGSQDFVKMSREYNKKAGKVERCASKVEELLKNNAEALEAFQKFREVYDEAISFEVRDFYKAGFRNGVQITADAFSSE